MYIKEIKLNSFKSFADKLNINLNESFTGIVGPNGSGKSNIVDAIKWVLGEQSVKTLRGSEGMTDVIFSGSKSRKPSSQASVSITFDNIDRALPLDYNEVSIKRVVSRTGENEYYLNNEKCRLKDINDLFVDTFSSRESFNIIPQNKIEEILSDKPEERRIIFEEAAGVLKYKRRKDETLRKLSKTHENIERINMITDELNTQIGPLETSSRKAREYSENKSKLESIEIALIAKDITEFNELLSSKKDLKDKLVLEQTNSNKNYSSYSAKIEKLKFESIKIEEELSDLRNEYIKNKEQLSSLLSKKELAIERSKYDKNSSEVKNKIVDVKEEKLKLSNQISLLEKEIEELDHLKTEKEKNLNSILNEEEIIRKELELERNNYNSLKRKEFEVSSKIELLNDNLENMSKLPYAVKAVLDNPTLKGVNDIIGNVVDTKEEYRIMLDIALGSSSNYIIVDTDEDAKEAINYLKNNNKGRATFFPLSVIKPRSIEPDILNIVKSVEGFIGVASDLVNYNSKYYGIIMNQLGNIIVCDTIANALKISKKINFRYRIVTLDGEILHVGGSLSGGSFKSNNSFILDKYEIGKLKVLLEQIKNNLNNSLIKGNELNSNSNLCEKKRIDSNLEVVKLSEEVNNKKNLLNEYKISLANIKSELKDLSENENSDNIIDKIINEYYKVENISKTFEQKIEFNEIEKRNILDEINNIEASMKKSNLISNQTNTKINEIEIEIVKLNMALDNLLNRLSEEYSLTYESAKSKYFLEIEEKDARRIVSELKRTLKSIGAVNLDSIEEFERINKRLTFLNTQKFDLEKSETDLLEIINNMDNVMKDKFEKTFNKINNEFSKVFTNLFGGGEAFLKLTNPNDMLETGIEIIAIPPGKNMKSISLLSGGEKTLTAISLLFSIMNLKKVPFVVLDEVESALDDVNAEKFGEYLSNYRNKTQLLLITHKKKTMEYVDLLYGVTMQESGVSKLVSVKLEKNG